VSQAHLSDPVAKVIPQVGILTDRFHVARTHIREQWLINVAVLLRPWFLTRGYEIPLSVPLGVDALSSNSRTLGECHAERDHLELITTAGRALSAQGDREPWRVSPPRRRRRSSRPMAAIWSFVAGFGDARIHRLPRNSAPTS
jgi:hypothetical protein